MSDADKGREALAGLVSITKGSKSQYAANIHAITALVERQDAEIARMREGDQIARDIAEFEPEIMEQAITATYGQRCLDFKATCARCAAWAWLDRARTHATGG